MNEKFQKFFNKQIYRIIHFDLHDFRNTVFLAGSARSGTTWLQEFINFDNQYRVLFEPFRPDKVEIISHWKYYQYLRAGENSHMYLDPMKDILSGRIKNVWVDTYNKRLFSTKRIIKVVFANLLLFWMKNHFPEVPIILIMRHPCAVANSKINIMEKHFRYDSNPLNQFLSQDDLMEDFLRPYEKQLKSEMTVFETFIFMWCIENLIPLTQFNEGEIYITYYENICLDAQKEIKKIFSFIGKPYSNEVLQRVNIPSNVSRKNSAISSGSDLINSWRKKITKDQIQRALEILNLFGLDSAYNDSDLPLLDGNALLRKYKNN